ncbi:MAG: CYTH domain protein [Candidatus Methanofastidiosum methylothiophilum]|uniref:CYTH domain protein n=1 Tax=Candidatus Methanofastidiosum methylothiophilum TaxID=1705564 RepID=A0A150JDI4_9EURY|nr:MAG: CYTH domain protein [Candidatus Methanofastidiosum methylthiophilus]OQC50753.1 MAG: CYTH domain protein [Euryarchaeota archaeon ADurb.Bin023]HNV94074.1 class IV adenylate cyclase [Methanofastidiosum sp.]KYC55952.1 MAG: CYTH domain protein [Candidatus Methanofastidiosum methylthiophilus]KYC57364.1 MAG: CYTH domain protein [Candidatus Methanofastidiosum methylthiophilus]
MLELEMKAKIDTYTRGRINQILRRAEFIEEKIEEDIYFSSPIKDFKETDEALRVRYSNNKVILTYKGPKLDKVSKSREEYEAFVSGEIEQILQKLGYKEVLKVKKKRKVYRYKEYIISIDEVEDLGEYLEVELKSDNLRDVEKIEGLFNLLFLDSERRSYLELLLCKKK